MANDYQDEKAAEIYLDFLNSDNGQIQTELLHKAILGKLPQNKQSHILDAACGPGWLSGLLKPDFKFLEACDGSEIFIKLAKESYPGINFKLASLEKPLPYFHDYFDCIILNMAAPDLSDLQKCFVNLASYLKPEGKLVMTIPNPKYTFPAAVWKRSVWDKITLKKPKLQFKNAALGGKIEREFGPGNKIGSHYYEMDDYLEAAGKANLKLTAEEAIRSEADSGKFDLNYQLYRYPLLLLLEFSKI